jgi:RNA polymerase sigma factor (sigma-70 family)
MYVGSITLTDARAELQHRATGTEALLPGDTAGTPGAPIDLDTFYRTYRARLKRTFAGMVRDLPGIDAEEVLQETMSRASKEKLARFATDTDLLKWCTRVGINIIAKHAGDLARRMEELHPDPDTAPGSRPAQIPDSLEERVVQRAELFRIFPQLKPEHREVLLLDATDHSYLQMAKILKINRDAVSKRLARARAAAQRILGPPVVAATVVGVFRKAFRGLWKPQQHPMAGSVLSVAMALVLVFPLPAQVAPNITTRPFASSATSVVAGPASGPAKKSAMSRPGAPVTVATGAAHRPSTVAGKRSPGLLPSLPTTCAAGHVCVGACGSDQQGNSGDWIYVKATGECVHENATPICQDVPNNPAVGCERSDDPQWLIGPPPSPIPKGEPL